MQGVRCPLALGSASTGGCIRAVSNVSSADSLVLSSGENPGD